MFCCFKDTIPLSSFSCKLVMNEKYGVEKKGIFNVYTYDSIYELA